MKMLRIAEKKDIARIAEILVFTKRQTYKDIFNDYNVSFNVIQVLSETEELKKPNTLDNFYVYEDKNIVKAIIKASEDDKSIVLSDFYVDPFFQNEGIGTKIVNHYIELSKNKSKELRLFVLDKNVRAIKFYEKFGFKYTGEKEEFADSGFYILWYSLKD